MRIKISVSDDTGFAEITSDNKKQTSIGRMGDIPIPDSILLEAEEFLRNNLPKVEK